MTLIGLNIQVMPLGVFADLKTTVRTVRDTLARPGSDFHKRLGLFLDGADLPHPDDHRNLIALVYDHGELVAWGRTEPWMDSDGTAEWQTLEAFVTPKRRRMGFAAVAASALAAEYLSRQHVAVFHWSMLLVASRAGLRPTLFSKGDDGVWRMAS